MERSRGLRSRGNACGAFGCRVLPDGNAPWCAGPLAQPLPASLRYQHLLEGIEVLNAFARAEHDRLQRIFGQMDRHPCLFAQPLIEAAQQSTTAGERDTAVHDVAGKLGRALVERGLDDVRDGADGSL